MLYDARILVADDDLDLLHVVADALVRDGASVTCANSGADLIEQLAHEGPFHLVITDVSMPWGSGLQAMHSARTAGIDTAVIVMTAHADETIGGKVELLGERAALLRKPFELAELETLASDLIGNGTHVHGAPQ